MAQSPRWKVYRGSEYMASTKYVEDAAALVALYGEDSSIRDGHSVKQIVWREGSENSSAAESYDVVAETVHERTSGRRAA